MGITEHSDIERHRVTTWSTTRLTDSEIVERILAGESAAFEGIMRRYNRLLFRIARGMVDDDESAKDLVQECYVRAFYRISQFQGPTGLASWLSRIVINEAISRSRKRQPVYERGTDVETIPIDRKGRPEEIAMGHDTLEMIESAIDKLPAQFRIVFMLRGVEELSVNETAEILSIKPATVKTRFHRAKQLMSKSLKRSIGDVIAETFSFDGKRCDSIVDSVFASIAGTSIKPQ